MEQQMQRDIDVPYFDKNGTQIKEFDVIKVFHFIGARKKKHFMYKWVRIIEYDGEKYYYAQHLTDATGFFEKGVDTHWTGYALKVMADNERKLMDTEIVQQYE